MIKKNILEMVSEVYLQGMSLIEAVIPRKTISNCYKYLTLESSRELAQDNQFSLFQIRKIEKELFDLIEQNKLKPKAETTKKITELQDTYSKYLIN